MRLRNVGADMTEQDVGVSIEITTNENLTGYNLEFIFVKPSGATITRTATSISGYSASYVTASGDIDESGDYYVFLRNKDIGFEYDPGNNKFRVRPKGEDQAVWK